MAPVVAIGGSASVGKTTLTAALASRLAVGTVAHVDDEIAAVERAQGPSFVNATENVWQRSAPWLCDELVSWTARLHPRIDELVTKLVAGGGGIIEGEGIDPRLAAAWDVDLVRVVYVVELDPQRLYETFTNRTSGSRFLALSPPERDAVVEMNRLYSRWLIEAAREAGQPCLHSQPWDTLVDRTLQATGF